MTLQVADNGDDCEGAQRNLAGKTLHGAVDAGHVMLGEQIVEPLAIDS
jgi:hypothetical protein